MEHPENILVRAPNWLGDTLMATPAVHFLAKSFPKAEITILCKPVTSEFWRVFPGIKNVLPLDGFSTTVSLLKQEHFDTALVMPISFSSAFMVWKAGIPKRIGFGAEARDLFLGSAVDYTNRRSQHLVWEYMRLVQKGFGVPLSPAESIRLMAPVTLSAKSEVQKLLKISKVKTNNGLIALGPGATYGPAKRWPASMWRTLIQELLSKRKESLIVIGGKDEELYLKELLKGLPTDHVHLMAGKTPVLVLATLLSKCKTLITNDTGPMHVSAGVGTPVVALFGSTSPLWTRPFGLGHRVIQQKVACSPCYQKNCNIGLPCLMRITPSMVLAEITDLLKKKTKIKSEKALD